MHVDVLIPKTTVSGVTPVLSIIQDQESYVDTGGAADMVFYVEVFNVNAGGGSLTLTLESSPTNDAALFLTVAGPITLAASSTPLIIKTIPGAASVAPLSRLLRWHVTASSSSTTNWSVTFRVRAARSRTPFFSPTLIPGCVVWFRSDLGVTLGVGSAVSQWLDQTGNTANTLSASGSPTWSSNGFTSPIPAPAVQTSSGTPDAYFTASGATIAQPDSMFLVAQSVGAPLAAQQIFISGPAGLLQALGQATSTTTTLNIDASAGAPKTKTVAALTTASIIQVDWDMGNTLVYQNGTVIGAAISPGSDSLQFGSIGNGPSGLFPVNANFAEVILYNSILTPAYRTLVTRYLGARYGISVP
jgi:hypothetical protein